MSTTTASKAAASDASPSSSAPATTAAAPAAAGPKKAVKKPAVKGLVKKSTASKLVIDCTEPANDEIFDTSAFEKFLHDRFKVAGKTGVLGDLVAITIDGNIVTVNAKVQFAKRYLKYLTKKFLKKAALRDYIRVIATPKGYHLRYFNFHQDEEEEQE